MESVQQLEDEVDQIPLRHHARLAFDDTGLPI